MDDKSARRKALRKQRRDHVDALPDGIRALLFKQPPAPLMAIIPAGAVIGLYHAGASEAPSAGYTKFFAEAGHTVALPRFADQNSAMIFARHTDPFGETDLESGPFGIQQPAGDAAQLIPDVVFVPLLGFTASGSRLGQGGGHYDKWLASNTGTIAVGMGWDCQLVDSLPIEPHDQAMRAIVTPTRLYGTF